jgi:hypothetical protein
MQAEPRPVNITVLFMCLFAIITPKMQVAMAQAEVEPALLRSSRVAQIYCRHAES